MRDLPDGLLEGVDAVVHLAAISNDPMGNAYEAVTLEINYRSCVELARKAKSKGASSFVFASSCSVYGYAEDGARTEQSPVDPLTALRPWFQRHQLEIFRVERLPIHGRGLTTHCCSPGTSRTKSSRNSKNTGRGAAGSSFPSRR